MRRTRRTEEAPLTRAKKAKTTHRRARSTPRSAKGKRRKAGGAKAKGKHPKAKSKRHGLHSCKSAEHYTPAEYVESARYVLGSIDLDPGSNARANQTVGACALLYRERRWP